MMKLTELEYQRILDFKRDLHMHPELSMKEYRTTEKIKEFLGTIPEVEILPLPVETGVVARIKGCRNLQGDTSETGDTAAGTSAAAPEVMLRADIDALPQTEEYESPWKSQNEGVMHACGHDFHTASLLGGALLLARMRREGTLKGDVDLVFQPAEEGTRGARALIDAGLFDLIHPKYCFGMHNWPSVRSGDVICHEGPLMSAKRNFTIVIYGAGGHGSMPHLNVDPIVCAAAMVQSLQTVISRNTNPLDAAILSINYIQGGSPVNLVVDRVEMMATIRSLSEEALDRAIERTKSIVANTAAAYECKYEVIWKERIPLVWNSPEMTELAKRCAGEVDCRVTDTEPSLASEDFALYRAFVPSFFYWVGSTPEGEPVEQLHRPKFHTDDTAMRIAAELYASSVKTVQ